MHAATRLSSHGRALEAVAQAKGAAGVSAALAGAAALAPPDLSEAYAAGLDGRALDSARLLVLARGGLESLNAASRAGCSEVSDFMTRALQSSGLFALVFRDAREAQAAVVLRLCDETVAAFELSSRRAAQTVTRPVKLGAMIRTVFTRPDGEPLHSFVLFEEENKALINGFIETFSAETCPRSAFALYVETHISPGKAASESDVARARLGERAIAAASEAYVALLSVVTHLIGLDHLPSLIARIRVLAAAADMTPRELEGLFLTLGHHQIGVAALMVISTLGSSGPAFSRMLESGGLANVLVAASNPALDEPSLNGCLIVLAFACGHSKSIAQALVDKGAFTLLQHAIRHDNVAVAVRASFAVASLAVSCDGAAEPLRWSGALDAIATARHRTWLSRHPGLPHLFRAVSCEIAAARSRAGTTACRAAPAFCRPEWNNVKFRGHRDGASGCVIALLCRIARRSRLSGRSLRAQRAATTSAGPLCDFGHCCSLARQQCSCPHAKKRGACYRPHRCVCRRHRGRRTFRAC